MAKLMKYLKSRGEWYHFERVVPSDVRDIIDKKAWREAFNTDSKVEAEAQCRRRTVETDEEIRRAREGTYRHLLTNEIEDIAIQWGIDFQLINRENIAREAFPDVWGKPDTIGDESSTPIIRKKADLSKSVSDWMSRTQHFDVKVGSADWDALLDSCLDEYLVSNPEISDGWLDILAEQNILPRIPDRSFFGTPPRKKRVDPDRKLSIAFQKYMKTNVDLSDCARSEFGTAVRRFIEFHGDIDVELIDRTHVENFRDGLKCLPVRPPNKIRALPMPKQIDWANINQSKYLQQGAVNKNLLGVKRTLDFAFEETSLIADRTWRNPFDGFIKKVRQTKNRVRAFTHEQVQIAFSKDVFQPKTAERFWIPLILFYTGARLDEIAQLHASDVRLEPVPHFVAENLEDEDPALAKKLKTETSHRTIPLHDDLIDLGILAYAKAVKDQGHTHLFADLPHERGKDRGGYVSRKFMDGFRNHENSTPTLVWTPLPCELTASDTPIARLDTMFPIRTFSRL